MSETIPESAVADVAAEIQRGAPLFDVREPDEYAQVHATGAVLIPLGEVADRAGEFPTDRPFYVICRSGARSGRAVEFLRSFDLNAVNVAGGILAWMDADLPTEHG